MTFEQLATRVFLIGAFAGLPMVAAPACANNDLRGSFVFSARGTTFAALGLPAPLTGEFASGGSAEFDGKGAFTLTAISSFNGVVQGPATVNGTYSVNADCSYTSQASNGATFRGVIVDAGRELLILQTTNGVAITGNARRRANNCNVHTIAGTYGFVAEGAAGAPIVPGAPFLPLAGVGAVTFDADGTFKMMAQRSVGGAIDPQVLPLAGKYVLTAGGCGFRMTFDAGFHFEGAVVDRDEIRFIETDLGSAVLVTAKRI
jgi:hypothetical protein